MVSHYTTLVPSLGLCIGPACEAGLSAGMRRERVEPPKEKEKERVRGAPLSGKNGKGIPVSPCFVLEVERSKLNVMDSRKRKLFVAVTAPKIVRFSLSKDQNFTWWSFSHSAEVQISRMRNAEVFFWPHSIVSSRIYFKKIPKCPHQSQRSPGGCAESDDQQTATSVERRS